MRVVANWFSSDMLAENLDCDLSGITRVISPYSILQLGKIPHIEDNDYLICREVTSDSISLISTDKRGINNIISSLLEFHNPNKENFKYLNVESFLNNSPKPTLDKVLNSLKLVEYNFQEHYNTEKLKDFSISLKKDFRYKKKSRAKNATIKNGDYSLDFLLNKVKEIHSPDIFSTLNSTKYVKKREVIDVPIRKLSSFQKIKEQFHLEDIVAKHLSISTICDLIVVNSTEEFAHYHHILKALDSHTEVVLKQDFQNWTKNFSTSMPSSAIELVKSLLTLIQHESWEELNENLFILYLKDSFLGLFNNVRLVKSKEDNTLLYLSNRNGSLSQSEAGFLVNYLNNFFPDSNTSQMICWTFKNLHFYFNQHENNQLIVKFN